MTLVGLGWPAGAQTPSIPFARLSLEQGLSHATVNCILQDRAGFLWVGTQDGLNRYDGYGFRVYKNDPTDPASLPHNWIEALAEDAAGNLWIGTQGGGLARWQADRDIFHRYVHDPADAASLPGDRVRALHFDRSGVLWVGTFQSGLARLADAEAGVFERFRHEEADAASLTDDRVRAIYEDRSGKLWIGTLAGLDRYDGAAPGRESGHFLHFRHDPSDPASLSDDRVTVLVEDHLGTLWVGTEEGLNRRDPGAFGFVRYLHDPADPTSLSHDLVWSLCTDQERRLWVATDAGLNLLRGRDQGFARYLHDAADLRSLSNDRVLSTYQDRGGVLWLGTVGGGLNKWNPITWSFAHYRADAASATGLSNNSVYAFAEDASGRLWIGTFGGGVSVLDRGTPKRAATGPPQAGRDRFSYYRHDPEDPGSLAGDQVAALLRDRHGVMWVGTSNGLDRFDPEPPPAGRFRHYRHDPEIPGSLSDDSVLSLYEDRSGGLWVGTFRGGLNRFERATGKFTRFRHDPGEAQSLSEDSVTTLTEDADGFLWAGTFGSGLNRFLPGEAATGAGTFHRIQHDPERPSSLSNDTVYALHVDAAVVLWVGTQVGLNKLAEPGAAAFRHYFERNGLASDVIYGLRSDAAGRLWIATSNGLSRLDPATETFKSYNESHGLQSNEFNFGAHFRSASGELFFGGVNGFNAFHPDRITSNTTVPPVVMTSFTKRNEPLDLGRPIFAVEAIELGWQDDFFDVEFAALDYTAPGENRYRYKLEGFNDDWIDIGHRRRVSFTNLDPGDYVLRLQGSNNDGVWNEEGASLAIRVEPPPWRTWWAYALYVLAVSAGLWYLGRSRDLKLARERALRLERERNLEERERLIAELERQNAELERFNYTVSHDLKTPLVTIKGFLGLLKRDAAAVKQDPRAGERLDQDVTHIAAAADHMSTLLDELLEFSRIGRQVNPPELVSLAELAGEAREMAAGLIAERGAEVVIAPDLPAVIGDRLRLRAVFQNLLENAVKYMGDQSAPGVEIGVRREGAEQVIYVRDNGIGIEAKYHDKVFGLFERLDAGDEGTGVGLALAKRIVESHGGRIWVESEGLGRGSTFCFVVGRGGGGPEPPAEAAEEPSAEPLTAG